jgi:hypothetical protein
LVVTQFFLRFLSLLNVIGITVKILMYREDSVPEFRPKTFDWGHGGSATAAAAAAPSSYGAAASAYGGGVMPGSDLAAYGGGGGSSRGSSLLEGTNNSSRDRSSWSPHGRGNSDQL